MRLKRQLSDVSLSIPQPDDVEIVIPLAVVVDSAKLLHHLDTVVVEPADRTSKPPEPLTVTSALSCG